MDNRYKRAHVAVAVAVQGGQGADCLTPDVAGAVAVFDQHLRVVELTGTGVTSCSVDRVRAVLRFCLSCGLLDNRGPVTETFDHSSGVVATMIVRCSLAHSIFGSESPHHSDRDLPRRTPPLSAAVSRQQLPPPSHALISAPPDSPIKFAESTVSPAPWVCPATTGDQR